MYAGPAKFWQLKVKLTADNQGKTPILHSMQINMVDVRGRTSPPGSPAKVIANGTIGRPNFVSRAQWGGATVLNNSVAPEWYTANHLVVHHTADSNSLRSSEASWSDRVFAEWSFHTYSRGWGDVGYNWLIDPNGVIYEGRNGSSSLDNDSVGFHDTANYGSMGVVMIGTFGPGGSGTPITPTAAAQDALVRILAWKASQRSIDPLGRSFYYGCSRSTYCAPFNAGSVVPNIAGHRQVTPGHTSCPGDLAANILDNIRNRVRSALGSAPDNGDTTIDDQESGFERSQNSWHESACGFGNHTYWTYATDGAEENWARWRVRLPQAGRWHVYAARPQGCSDTAGKAFSKQAKYKIQTANGSVTVTRDQNTNDDWIDLGIYNFNTGDGTNVSLGDSTGEPLNSWRVLFFDTVKWVYEPELVRAELTKVEYASTTVEAGSALQVKFTIRNSGTVAFQTQGPPPGKTDNIMPGQVYLESECFSGNKAKTYPVFPRETGRLRVALGATENGRALGSDCIDNSEGYPWRWGISDTLQPGETRTIVGYVAFDNRTSQPRTITLRPNLLNEYVTAYASSAASQQITITPERSTPQLSVTDGNGTPLAVVFRLTPAPQSLLMRSKNPLSVKEGGFLGAFTWDGAALDWQQGGPLGQTDQFIVRQVRPFVAPQSGVYTFELTSDDGGWLWIDGQQIIDNSGLHGSTSVSGSLWLEAGVHELGVKYLEWYGGAYVRYSWIPPGQTGFTPVPVPRTITAPMRGATYGAGIQTAIAVDDLGGIGINTIKYHVDNGDEHYVKGHVLPISLGDGNHIVTYSAMDNAGNWSPLGQIAVNVDTAPPITTLTASYQPNGTIALQWSSSPDAIQFELQYYDTSTQVWAPMQPSEPSPQVFVGRPGHIYQFMIRAFDGLNWANFTIAQSQMIYVPADAPVRTQYLPTIAR